MSDRIRGFDAGSVLTQLDLEAPDVALALAVGRALFLWALDPMMLTQPGTGEIFDANPAACRTLGLSVQQIRDRGREGLRDPNDPRWLAGVRERAATGRFLGELRMMRGDGSTFPAEVSSSVFEVGGRQYAVLIFRDVSDRHELEQRLRAALAEMERCAAEDELTGLLNRRGFLTVGNQLVEEARRQQHPLVVLTLDVDGLKQVNDQHGHATGDDMLCDVAATLRAGLRTADVIARIGGDEFAVILTGVRAPSDAALAVQRINARLTERARREHRPYPLTTSVGVATGSPNSPYDLDTLLRAADEHMYEEKRKRAPAPVRTRPETE